ncbi:PREDICTED: uncharacterized protein LOC104749231 [Camelina sativa]|uniref:Uncharacterized protein LOC104749231 n=1 Tax=Camelina sativa TaxID=90675 RepID=A0ABM0WCJ1_CAMSA|nr:PREDICTED: uncharacterized protein LOC104749231 [Camelina sativa]
MPSVTSETKIGVFWDVEDCKLPDGLQPDSVSWNIKSALQRQGYGRNNVSIRAYGEKHNKSKDELLLDDIMFLPAGDASARCKRMVADIDSWALNNPASNLMVICRCNMDFATFLKDLKARDFHILGAKPDNAPPNCSDCRITLDELFTQAWIWESLSSDGGGDPIARA